MLPSSRYHLFSFFIHFSPFDFHNPTGPRHAATLQHNYLWAKNLCLAQVSTFLSIYSAIRLYSRWLRIIWSWKFSCLPNSIFRERTYLVTADFTPPITLDNKALKWLRPSKLSPSSGCRGGRRQPVFSVRAATIDIMAWKWLGITMKHRMTA